MSVYVYSHDSWYTVIYPDDKKKSKSFSQKKNEKSALNFILVLYSVKSGGLLLVLNECPFENSSVNKINFYINSLLTKMKKVTGDCLHLPVILIFSSQMTFFLSSVYFHLLSTLSFSLQCIYQEGRSFLLLVLKLFSWQYWKMYC